MAVKHVTVIVGELYVMLTDLSIVRKVDKITYHGGFSRRTLENDVAVMRVLTNLKIVCQNNKKIHFSVA